MIDHCLVMTDDVSRVRAWQALASLGTPLDLQSPATSLPRFLFSRHGSVELAAYQGLSFLHSRWDGTSLFLLP